MSVLERRKVLGYSEGRSDGYEQGLNDGSRVNLLIGAILAGPAGLVAGWLISLLMRSQGC